MKNAILTLAMSAAFVSCGAGATGKVDITNPFDHATRTELKAEASTRANADNNLQGQINQTRADGAAAIGQTNQAVKSVDDKVNHAIGAQIGVNNHVQHQISDVNGKADHAIGIGQQNASDIKATNAVVAGHTATLNEYGTRLDNQDLMNSQFAGDINSIKSQQAGFASELHKQGKRIGQVENGLAGVAALASIQFNTDPEAGFQVGCGVAQIRSNNGMSCGAGGALNKNWFVSGYVMQASSSSGVAASATYSFGR